MSVNVTVRGIEDVNRILADIAPNEARNLLRSTTFEMAKRLARSGAENVPDGAYKTGQLESDVKPKRERGTKTTIAASVRVAARSFYWRFLEYGQGPDGVEHAMFLRALQELRPDIDRVYLEIFTKKLVARLAKLARKRGG